MNIDVNSDGWRGREVLASLEEAGWLGIQRASVYYHNALKQALNVSGKVGRGTKGIDYVPAPPGFPPRKRTGWLQRNVVRLTDKSRLTVIVGVTANAVYGLYLEFGTRRMRARPFVLATLHKVLPQLKVLMAA